MSVQFQDLPIGTKFAPFAPTKENHWTKVSTRTAVLTHEGKHQGFFYWSKNERVEILNLEKAV